VGPRGKDGGGCHVGDNRRRSWKWLAILAAVVTLLAIAAVQVVNGFGSGQVKCDSIAVGSDGKEHRVCP
jgi:hypothetical protein